MRDKGKYILPTPFIRNPGLCLWLYTTFLTREHLSRQEGIHLREQVKYTRYTARRGLLDSQKPNKFIVWLFCMFGRGVLYLDVKQAFGRTELLLGADAMQRLARAHVWVFGAGGVGSFCMEALVRAGCGKLTVVDGDAVDITNCNRQIIADCTTLGIPKVEAAKERALRINPDIEFCAIHSLFLPENAHKFDFSGTDFIVDAIDMVSAKLELAVKAAAENIPLISSMGTGNKLDPSMLEIGDIFQTSMDPLARVMRRELKKRGISSLPVVWSKEPPKKGPAAPGERPVTASVPWVPPVAGLMMAGYVVRAIARV